MHPTIEGWPGSVDRITLFVKNVSYFDAVRPVVTDENLILVVGNNTVWKLQVAGAAKLVQHGSVAIKHDDTHHLYIRAQYTDNHSELAV